MITINCLITFCFPILALPFSLYGIYKNFKNWRKYIFLLALFCAVVAYCYTPVKNKPDIVRYFEWAEQLSGMSFWEAIMYKIKDESNLYLLNLLLWLGGELGDVHLIPAVSVFFVYYICFYVTCSMAEKEKVNAKYVFWYVIFALITLNFYAITNNVRNVLGFCLIGLAVHRDLYQKKRNIGTLSLYIIPLFLHPSVVLLVLLRFFLLIPGNYKIILILLASQVMPITDFFYKVFASLTSNNPVVLLAKNLVVKAYWYYRNEESAWAVAVASSGSQKLSKILYISLAIVMCAVIYLYQRKQLAMDKENFIKSGRKQYADYVFYTGIITIACAPMPMPEYWRFVSVFIVLAGTVLIFTYGDRRTGHSLLSKAIFAFSPVALTLWMRELLSCDLLSLFFGPIFMNPIVILIKDLLRSMFM